MIRGFENLSTFLDTKVRKLNDTGKLKYIFYINKINNKINAIFKHHSTIITEDIIKELCANITAEELETYLLI
jgi:hypothetical protein